ncbi:MAG: hypothetical protein U9R55_10150 [Pseudomonadota bacterium]|jgi:hypothetical protein|uniref:SCO family protein n=1 Tax=Curvibacter delicatus TaxID=80879 RepID=UPI000836B20A|nr:hypothetical protein [Curvibacter delicatus]MEA3394977.1 hypothetical protein [Pseudomonadota bacterium]
MSGSKLSEDSSNAKTSDAGGDHPLGLTVYSLPEPGQAMAEEARRTRLGRWKMIAVMLVCAAPVVASYFTYYVIRPEGRRNFGELIDPQRPLPEQAGAGLDGKTVNLAELKGQWLLLSVGGGNCQAACVQQLYLQRQLREGLGKDKDRIDRVWLVNDAQPVAPELLPGLKEATVLRVPPDVLDRWLTPAAGHAITEHLYLVDPLGNLMMRFPANLDVATAAQAKRDLERLMRASNSWDQAGR